MLSTGWKSKQMPIIFWSAPVKEFAADPRTVTAMEAEVELPDGQRVIVDEIRYRGINGDSHGWQGNFNRLAPLKY
jgi:hypothetical protein